MKLKLALCYAGYVAAVLLLSALMARGQMCGDCDGDGTVVISEIIRAVGNALDPCHLWQGCVEQFTADIDGVEVQCDVNACPDDIDACVRYLYATTRYCFPVAP